MTELATVLSLIITSLLSVALITLVERKILATVQARIGPNVVGFLGMGQPFADALKLIVKETIFVITSNGYLFLFSPVMVFFLALLSWAIIIFDEESITYDFPLNALVIALITSLLGQYILFSGWSSGSKYALLGALRATAQFISYEMFISLALLNVTLSHQSLNLIEIANNQAIEGFNLPAFYLGFVFFFVAVMAENNRPPFDLPEAEGELVAGYHVEYTSLPFALFYISEYSNFLFNAILLNIVFGAISSSFFSVSYNQIPFFDLELIIAVIIIIVQVWIRASLPRFMMENIMDIGWKYALIINLAMVFLIFNLVFIQTLYS